MIESYHIDASLGYDDQVGLYVQADVQMARRFYWALRQAGFNCIPCRRSNRAEFNHFAYVARPDSGLDKASIAQQLRPLCEVHSARPSAEAATPGYETWRASFDTYVQAYRVQRVPRLYERPADAFDKARAYDLIQSGRYDEAAQYLGAFATDDSPPLVPAYLVYLYHAWERFDDLVAVYTRYAHHLHASDVDYRVIEWIVGAHLRLESPRPEQALAVLDAFLPEFQRQGVAERLLALRAQARALQGQLPQTISDLQAYINRTSGAVLAEQLSDLLGVIAGQQAPTVEIEALLDELAACIEPAERWQVTLEKSALARHSGDVDSALTHLRAVLDASPSVLDAAALDALRLDAANLHLALEQPESAVTWLEQIAPDELMESDQRAYWRLLGLALVAVKSPSALEALRRAYELGVRQPDVLRPLARLAYQADDWTLAQRAYTDLLQSGFEPGLQDRLYAGILAWLEDVPHQAVELLRDAIPPLLRESGLSRELLMAHEALVESLRAVEAPPEDLAGAIGGWTDTLVASNDLEGLERLVGYVVEVGLDRATTFTLLEAIEPSLTDHPPARARLAQTYVQLLCAEVDASLRRGQALPAYTLDLRRGLFELDRERFDFVQEYLEDELARAREAELVAADFALEPVGEPALDLSGRWVALVGGYAPVRRRVCETLTRDYRLGRFTEVPPSWEDRVDQSRVAEAVRDADLIVVVHRCVRHDGTDALRAVVAGTEMEARVRYAAGKGQSSVFRAVREYFEREGV